MPPALEIDINPSLFLFVSLYAAVAAVIAACTRRWWMSYFVVPITLAAAAFAVEYYFCPDPLAMFFIGNWFLLVFLINTPVTLAVNLIKNTSLRKKAKHLLLLFFVTAAGVSAAFFLYLAMLTN